MQKVITVTTKAYIEAKEKEKFIETEYPELNKALTEGYRVAQVIPVIQNGGNGAYYDTIFVLAK